MSDFLIVCGTIPKQEVIINLDTVKRIYLSEQGGKTEVVVEDINDKKWSFETDLTNLRDVLVCVQNPLFDGIAFTQGRVDFVESDED